MYFYSYELKTEENGYEVILYIRPQHSLVEFANEFGITENTEKDLNRLAISYVKRKFPNLRVKAIKIILGGVLVTSIMLGGAMSPAFAAEVPSSETMPEEAGETAEGTTQDISMDDPGLVPGDFFYFVETIAEKVQLALTFEDTAKAELISKFANERIAEANSLFDAGDTDGAIQLLNQALGNQELALDYVADDELADGTAQEEEAPDAGMNTGIMPSEDDSEQPENETVREETETEDPVAELRYELESHFSRNMTALLLAMEKVENPTAKAALAKNVEKTYARMEKRAGKAKAIENGIANKVPVNEALEILRDDIQKDEQALNRDMEKVEKQAREEPVKPAAKTPSLKEKASEKAGKGIEKGHQPEDKGKKGQAKVERVIQERGNKKKEPASISPVPASAPEELRRNEIANPNFHPKQNREVNPIPNPENGTKTDSGKSMRSDINTDFHPSVHPKSNKEKGNQGRGSGKNP
ncbi:hypothetical protein GWK91_00345 [Virgibacillus sp. MSP4-1]|uniref:DUF5667 domain-containing protein n=1 Tax=Virgibacillus sp. MSP4-1 TaxID=2700081 RepID=UPI0003A84926|nr:DUF5667 domain-containing protein [Virgibacillus sp. MSP4-1]QHS21499.1 hypothetical protein GWK91_00345 [Virgibacillus sp. MSP4-1]